MDGRITVRSGIRIAVRHPNAGELILAKTLAGMLNKQEWLNDEFKLKFCIRFIDNLMDGSIERSADPKIMGKLEKRSFTDGIRLLRKRPDDGINYMIAMVMKELRLRQGFDERRQFVFYEELLANFFPSHTVSDFIGDGGVPENQ
ncbi:MAG: hypothetical protein JW808_11505 [Victivallales bacterium]|nr:hypothetical protein [Victivallales bacterium]